MKQDPFSGPWRIVWMSDWDQDYVDMDVSGHVTFGAGRSGSFQFGLVQGHLYIHLGDDSAVRGPRSAVRAVRQAAAARKSARKGESR